MFHPSDGGKERYLREKVGSQYLTHYSKINLEWCKNLNIYDKNFKILERNLDIIYNPTVGKTRNKILKP